MKKIYLFSLSVILTLIFIRCDNDNEIINDEKIICKEYSEFYFYKGSNYIFDFIEYTDGSIDFLGDTTNTDFLTISNVLQSKSLSILTFTDDENGTTYLFDDHEQKENYLATIRKPVENTLKSASNWRSLYIRCYANAGYLTNLFDAADPGNGLDPTTYSTGNWLGFSNLAYISGQNFNDDMESIQILNYTGMEAEIQLFVDKNFSTTGCNWTIFSRPSSQNLHGDSNQDNGYRDTDVVHLQNFGTRFAYSTRKLWWYDTHYWDNKITSMRWRLVECIGFCATF